MQASIKGGALFLEKANQMYGLAAAVEPPFAMRDQLVIQSRAARASSAAARGCESVAITSLSGTGLDGRRSAREGTRSR